MSTLAFHLSALSEGYMGVYCVGEGYMGASCQSHLSQINTQIALEEGVGETGLLCTPTARTNTVFKDCVLIWPSLGSSA